MIIEILNKTLDSSWISSPIDLELDRKQTLGKKFGLSFIEIVWEEVAGTFDGILSIFLNSSNNTKALERQITINSESNTSDSNILIMDQRASRISFSFSNQNITSGILKVFAGYRTY